MKCKKCKAAEARRTGFCGDCERLITAVVSDETLTGRIQKPSLESFAERQNKLNKIKIAAREEQARAASSDLNKVESETRLSRGGMRDLYAPWINASYIAIVICIVSSLLILVMGDRGSVRFQIFLISILALFFVFLFAGKTGSENSRLMTAIIKTCKFAGILILVAVLKKCAGGYSSGSGEHYECEYGIGGTPICRAVY